jgi:hypothetical protein
VNDIKEKTTSPEFMPLFLIHNKGFQKWKADKDYKQAEDQDQQDIVRDVHFFPIVGFFRYQATDDPGFFLVDAEGYEEELISNTARFDILDDSMMNTVKRTLPGSGSS